MDVGHGTSGMSADVPERRSWTSVGLNLMIEDMGKKAIHISNWKKNKYRKRDIDASGLR